ncbi:TonB-dependent receptor [Maribacter algarum]|uniref:TonB-dependent receptor n=1 Tax=Maribacter algarum (ex Zhang et al. 2020) TaxID=2578118 RepID=A0A5S3PQ39_9FLAO|nr:TonB-dependent receptor [Maribacter algarum]TMM56749.1 TonB-dependent receptor [Maribacter algarum]
MNKTSFLLFLVFFFTLSTSLLAQVMVSGTVNDESDEPLVGANILLKPSNQFGVTDRSGNFQIDEVNSGEYIIVVSYLGLKTSTETITVGTENISLTFSLEKDLLNLQNVVVTGNFDPRVQLESSTAVTTLSSKDLKKVFSRGTADVLQAIPGTFTDPSAGEVFTKVYSRGISASAEDDLGWYYVSLQEDGLPVSLVQHSYYTPELFHRLDLTTDKVEGIRGGSAAITALNAPGGIYNFISKGISNDFAGEVQVQGGLQGESNPFYRADLVFSGPLRNNWFYSAGGHYRRDEGARNTDFTFSKGGQAKFNLTKVNDKGYFKFYGKILDDFTNRWTGVAATNWNDPQAAFGQDFNTTSLLMPAFSANIPDGRRLSEGAINNFDPSQGVHAQDRAFGVDLLQSLGNGWSVRNNLKFSNKRANWQTSISNNFVGLDDFLVSALSRDFATLFGGDFSAFGNLVFRDAQTGNEIAQINNFGALGIFQGDPPSFDYLTDGRLPNDAIMGTATWLKDNTAKEWMNQLTFRKKSENHDFNFGLAGGFSNSEMFTQGSFAYVTYEPNPRMLRVTVENPGAPVLELSDENGVSNYGGLFYINSRAKVSQIAAFANDRWKIAEKFHLDLGLRYETINHDGSNDRFAPFAQDGGVDGDATTIYDNGVLAPTGEQDEFDYNYSYLSHSIGLNYKFQEDAALFARFTGGNKAPELSYYYNNFSNVPVNQKGEVQKINQFEMGLKWNLSNFSFTTTAFWSQLRNIGVGSFEFDGATSTVFYTPIQLNSSRTIGLEWESAYALTTDLRLTFNGALQNPIATDWTIYDAAGSVDTADDSIVDYSDNVLPFNPKVMFNLGTEYQKGNFDAFLRWQFMGEREGNIANAFQLPSYNIFNGGLGYSINKNLSANLIVTNLFNSAGLANFFGANSFGANANGVTSDFIQNNPDASFVVVPVLPRGSLLKLSYTF